MLNNADVTATVAVKNQNIIKDFYEGVLGLKKVDENPGGTTFACGSGKLFVYTAPTGGTNQATSATWAVDDVEGLVKELSGKGQKFEHYDLPETTREGDIHSMGPAKAAWLKDPDGNVLAFIQM